MTTTRQGQNPEHDPPVRLGTRWVWEIERPTTIAVVEVIDLKDNGEEWMVQTRTLLGKERLYSERVDQTSTHWNELGRFREACLPVGRPR